MIKIRTFFSKDIQIKYEEYMTELLKTRYEDFKSKNTVLDVVKELFEKNGHFNYEKVKRLLVDKEYVEEIICGKTKVELKNDELKQVSKIMNYDEIFSIKNSKVKEYFGDSGLRHALLSNLNIAACPYCNRQYISNYVTPGGKKTTADLDHFKHKAKYPFLSLSLYNFIPSCQICNERMKKENDAEIIYPYDENFGDDCIFQIVPVNAKGNDKYKNELDVMRGIIDADCEIDFKVSEKCMPGKKKRINNSLQVFELKTLYQEHIQDVQKMRLKRIMYETKESTQLLEKIMPGISNDEKDRILYGFNWEDGEDINRPLSKLTFDIVKR